MNVVSSGSQTVPVTTKAECDKLRATIANIRSEMRRDAMASVRQPSVEGGSPFARVCFYNLYKLINP